MNGFQIVIKKTLEVGEEEKSLIIRLKQQHWGYTNEEQKDWFEKNILDEDIHLMLFREGELHAYLNAVNVDVTINESVHGMLGIGNVCVDKANTHKGIGSILMACMNCYLREFNIPGILLCKEALVNFYRASNWVRITPKKTVIQDMQFEHCVMIYDPDEQIGFNAPYQIRLFRNF